MAELAILLRDDSNASASVRLALKADQLSISVGKQPMQIPLPGASPIIMDLGSNRPSITVSGLVDNIGMDKKEGITVNFHRRRLTEDQDLFVREGDFVRYGSEFYEIAKLVEPKQLFGQIEHRFEITAMCIDARQGLFDGS